MNALLSKYTAFVMDLPRGYFALCLGLCSGLIAVLIDVDHITLYFGHPSGRVAHTPLFILAGIVALYCCARIGGLLIRLVLRR